MARTNYLLLVLVVTMSLCGCQPTPQTIGNPERPYPPVKAPAVGDILHLPTGFYVSPAEMFDQAQRAQVIFVGETHDNPASHRLQEDILTALQNHNPGQVSLAMEMFTPSQQPVLDRWVAGRLAEKAFLKEVDWYRNWSMNFALYRPLLIFCRDHQIPILALNAEKELTQKVGRTDFRELSAAEQQKLPQMDHTDPYQTAMVKAFYAGHNMGQAMEDGFQRVQTLWDESMAQNLAEYLNKQEKSHQVMVIAGGNHVRYGFGIPRRMFRRIPASYLLIGSEEIDIPEDKQDRLMDVKKPEFPMLPYHFMLFTAYEDLPDTGVKLGIILDRTEGGLIIKGVTPGSIAERNDLKTDDLLIRIDQQSLKEPFDLIYELQQKKPGDTLVLTLERGTQRMIKTIHVDE
ncbi:MAG: ChaN family lipoprotein [Desulfuromonadales bacterium]|nr:ChaN family lipoprotein [Desulfuromonadales bacterium]MBN2792731.1 ChaN family lipoprotein [Desulfuromonadales bacterium]